MPHRRLGLPQEHHRQGGRQGGEGRRLIGDALRAFANGREDGSDSHLMLGEFVINNTASTLGESTATTRRLTYPRISPILAAAQAARKATLDAGRGGTAFKVGDCALLRTKELPRSMRCSPTVNVSRLKPVFERAGAPPALGLVADRPGTGGRARGGATAQPPTGAQSHALPDKVAEYDVSPPRRLAGRREDMPPRRRPAAGGRSCRLPAAADGATPAQMATGPALLRLTRPDGSRT